MLDAWKLSSNQQILFGELSCEIVDKYMWTGMRWRDTEKENSISRSVSNLKEYSLLKEHFENSTYKQKASKKF